MDWRGPLADDPAKDRPPRVLFLTPYFRPYLGGIERAIEQLAFQLMDSRRAEAVGVLTTKYSFPRVAQPQWADRETTPEGIAIYRLKGFPRWSLPIYSVPLVWFSPLRIRRYLDEFRPDVVHFVGDGWFWGHIWAWLWFRGRARFVFTPSFHVLPWTRWWLRPFNILVCRVMDRVVSLTRQEARAVRRTYLAPASRQEVIGWGAALPGMPEQAEIDAVAPHTAPRDDSPQDESLVILCVGRLGWHKGQEWLLRVFDRARAGFRRPAQLVCVGRNEDAEESLRRRIAELGLDDHVSLTGEASDRELSHWYSRAGIFALFSHYEAFGLVYFEAMAYGVPVLTHDVGANAELLTRGAVVTPRFDEDAAVDELVRLVNDEARRRDLGRQAREYVLSEFTWEKVAEKYLAVYRE